MTILFLGPQESPLHGWLKSQEEMVVQTAEPIDVSFLKRETVDFIVSYGYRHILKSPVLECVEGRAVNLHISYLPWNRGADPNFWSFVDGTPRGVTIHYIDEGVDTGDVIAQREVSVGENDTLASSYQKLQKAVQDLFRQHWHRIRTGQCQRTPQPPGGSCHRSLDKEPHMHLLTEGWDTPVSKLRMRR